ncbi:MAG TPA: GMC family oxidoreductase [Solirubrobacteraceae bacterium]|nr:GMC family oxidoreductase [Solirubrobacteraceae bacterium]
MTGGRNPLRPTGDAAYLDGTSGPRPRERRVERGGDVGGRRRVRVDAVVVGTGAGGAVVAKELAEAGLSVAMLEEGEWVEPEELTARPRDVSPRLYRDGAQVVTLGNVAIPLPLGRAVGGTTLLNSGTCYRTPPALLDRWGLWTAEELEPFFRRVERIFNVCRVPREVAGANAHAMERGAHELGWSGEYLHRASRGCVGSGVCAFGCPSGGKQHTANTYVPLAWDAGATTYTGCRVTEVLVKDGTACGVVARTAGGGRLRVDAELVVVACGAIHTPGLLARSGVRGARGQRGGLGANLSIHPCSGVWAEFDEPVEQWRGVPQAYAVDEFAAEGIMLEGWAGPPDMLALSLPATGAAHRRLMLRARHVAQAGLMVRDSSRGRVRSVAGRPVIRYDVNPRDQRLLLRAIARAAELELAAGATAVHVPIRGAAPVRTRSEARAIEHARVSPNRLGLSAFHPLGTAAAGTVVDADLRVSGVDNLLVADGSVVPSALGVNPQLTIMALATRAAFAAAGRSAPTGEPRPETVGRAFKDVPAAA